MLPFFLLAGGFSLCAVTVFVVAGDGAGGVNAEESRERLAQGTNSSFHRTEARLLPRKLTRAVEGLLMRKLCWY